MASIFLFSSQRNKIVNLKESEFGRDLVVFIVPLMKMLVVVVVVVNILYISGLLHFVHRDGIFSYVFGRER